MHMWYIYHNQWGVVDVVDATYTTAWIYITYTTTDIKVKWNAKMKRKYVCNICAVILLTEMQKTYQFTLKIGFFLLFDPQGLETCYVQLPVSLILAFR